MYELLEPYFLRKSLDDDVRKTASDLCSYMNFHNWCIIIFNPDKSYGFIRYASENNIENIYFPKLDQQSYLDLLIEKKKVLVHKQKNNTHRCNPLSKNASIELYYPLFSTIDSKTEIAGCLYFSRMSDSNKDVTEFLSDEYIISKLLNIQRGFEAIYIKYLENKNFFNLMHIFSDIIKKREPYMETHPYNVANWSNLIGQELDFSEEKLYVLYMAAILHDIGKFYLPESILNKPGALTAKEKKEIMNHPIYSYYIVKDLISGVEKLSGIENIILQHHERFDGTGYPKGLKGEDILLEGRILAVADSVDSMLSKRSYKKTMPINNVINQLMLNKGTQFDPDIAQIMVNILISKQKNQEIIFNEPILIGTLAVLTKEKSYHLQGTLIKTFAGYKFKIDFDENMAGIKKNEIIESTFYIEHHKKLYEYEADIVRVYKKNIYISQLTPKSSSNFFSLIWELNGVTSIKDSSSFDIIINKIGGDMLIFYVNKDQFNDENILNDINNIRINFDDDISVTVTGRVTSIIKVGHKIYCDFKYINILESTRDQIFKQIFKKQAEFRKSLVYAMTEK